VKEKRNNIYKVKVKFIGFKVKFNEPAEVIGKTIFSPFLARTDSGQGRENRSVCTFCDTARSNNNK
jgi:hypothetical protein